MAKGIQLKDSAGNKVYPAPYFPIGSIYLTIVDKNPSTYFGGTWEKLSGGFIYASTATSGTKGESGNGSGTDTGAASGNTGASSGNTGASSGNTGSTTLTTSQIPAHTHSRGTMNIVGAFWTRPSGSSLNIADASTDYQNPNSFDYEADAGPQWNSALGLGGTSNQKTDIIRFNAANGWSGNTSSVGGGGGHTHSLNSHTHSLNSHTHSLNSHTHTIPYIAVYVWKRVA